LSSFWKPFKVFYGWWIVSACFFISIIMAGAVYYGFTSFIEPLEAEYGWSRTQVSLAASIRGMEMGLFAPLMGFLADRLGPRWPMFGGIFFAGLGFLLWSRVTSLGMFYVSFALLAFGVSACVGSVPGTAVANWFRRRMGTAVGITNSGLGLGGMLVFVITRLIDIYDWRMTLVILGLSMWIIGLPLALIFRDKPEKYGYLPDGDTSGVISSDEELLIKETIERDVGVQHALKTRTFWHLTLAMTGQLIIISSILTHIMPYLSSVGILRSVSSQAASILPLVSVVSRFGSGLLGDRFSKKRVTGGSFLLTAIGLLFFAFVSNEQVWLLVPFIIFYGLGFGSTMTMCAAMIRENFGRTNFGTINGIMLGIMALGSISGPLLAGWVFDTYDSYHLAWFTFAGLALVSLIVLITTPPVKRMETRYQ